MDIEAAVKAIYALRGYPEKTMDDINMAMEVDGLRDDAEYFGYAFTSETIADFQASGWAVSAASESAHKLTLGKSDIYIVQLNDPSMGAYDGKNLTFLDA